MDVGEGDGAHALDFYHYAAVGAHSPDVASVAFEGTSGHFHFLAFVEVIFGVDHASGVVIGRQKPEKMHVRLGNGLRDVCSRESIGFDEAVKIGMTAAVFFKAQDLIKTRPEEEHLREHRTEHLTMTPGSVTTFMAMNDSGNLSAS